VSPENQIVILCARALLAPGARDRVAELLLGGVDWGGLYDLSVTQGTMPLLFRNLHALRSIVPAQELRALARHYLDHSVRCQRLRTQLTGLLDAMEAAGVEAIPYKGPALAAFLYGDESMRLMGDLDLIVRQADVRLAMRALQSQGYRLHGGAMGAPRLDLRNMYHLEFSHPARFPVELHWRFCDDLLFPVDWEQWRRRLVTVDLAGRAVKVLGPEETLLSLVLHGAKDLWNRLGLLTDVAELVRGRPLDWSAILAASRGVDARRMLLVPFLAARELLALDLPEALRSLAEEDPVARRLALRIARRLRGSRTRNVRAPERIRFALAVRTQPRDWARYAANYLRIQLTPDELDLACVEIPPAASFLYYVVRPARRLLSYLRLTWDLLGRRRRRGGS
jgi:hypothetical protein